MPNKIFTKIIYICKNEYEQSNNQIVFMRFQASVGCLPRAGTLLALASRVRPSPAHPGLLPCNFLGTAGWELRGICCPTCCPQSPAPISELPLSPVFKQTFVRTTELKGPYLSLWSVWQVCPLSLEPQCMGYAWLKGTCTEEPVVTIQSSQPQLSCKSKCSIKPSWFSLNNLKLMSARLYLCNFC